MKATLTVLLFLCLLFLGATQDILTYKIKTPTNGKTHLAMVPPNKADAARLKTLFVFFHGTTESARSCTRLGRLGAQLGYYTVLISYKSVPSVRSLCNWWDCVSCPENNECFEGIRDERVFGANRSEIEKTTWNDSLEGMLVYVLKKMATIDSEWKQFLQKDYPDYSNMIVAGHSQGAGHAAFIASRYKVKRAILFSGTHEVAAWNTRSRNPNFQTPSDRIYAFSHIQDTSGGWRFLLGWETLEIPCGPKAKMEQIPFGDNGREWCSGIYVDDAVDPSFDFQGNHRLLLQGTWIFSKRKAHIGTALDRAVPNLYKNNIGGKPRWYGVVWRYLLMDNATLLGPDEWELPDLNYGSFETDPDEQLQSEEKDTKDEDEDEEERDENEEGEDFINENDKDRDDGPEETEKNSSDKDEEDESDVSVAPTKKDPEENQLIPESLKEGHQPPMSHEDSDEQDPLLVNSHEELVKEEEEEEQEKLETITPVPRKLVDPKLTVPTQIKNEEEEGTSELDDEEWVHQESTPKVDDLNQLPGIPRYHGEPVSPETQQNLKNENYYGMTRPTFLFITAACIATLCWVLFVRNKQTTNNSHYPHGVSGVVPIGPVGPLGGPGRERKEAVVGNPRFADC